ncbi:MAG: ABC transporter ATP-binding protein [Clostridiales bacterium]|nr:ABC transporter ATP-binding protein [Clostridiales bacterium]MDO4350638.1 ABC transporter ATP-binding protein [Eubacteriales bacterium]MDY4009865.1 ABC transporter ATP-binding protein [Candidatus Limiplasma sp.]
MVKYENITVRYDSHTVVENFSLEIHKGEILGIVGPSGCGKTTLVRALGGFLNPDQGEIYINNELVYSKTRRINRPPEARKLGIVFQDYAVWPHLSVWDNVMYPLKKRRVPKEKAGEMVKHALEQVQMKGYEKYMPAQLSGGQQQRVAIARALTCSNELVIMDEPITNLDAKLREGMLEEIRALQQRLNTTIIYITHDQEAALQLCDRVVIMEPSGRISQIGTDEEIIEHPANRFVFSFIGVSNFIPVAQKDGKYYLWQAQEALCYASQMPKGYLEGRKNVMGVRPMDIVFDDDSPVKGVITQAVFLGSMYNFFVRVNDIELRVQRSTLDSLDGREYREGETVGLRFLNEKYYEAEESEASA